MGLKYHYVRKTYIWHAYTMLKECHYLVVFDYMIIFNESENVST